MFTSCRKSTLWFLGFAPLIMVACGGDNGAAVGGAPAEAVVIDNPGMVTGTVAFTGAPPAPQPIDMRDEPACLEKHSEPPVRHTVIVNDNGTLQNVFVWVREGIDQRFPVSGDNPVLDQVGCIYTPHVIGVQTGQNLTIRNSDPVMHNVNARPSVNRTFNFSQPREGMESQRSFTSQEIMIPVQCDVHGWMTSYIGVVDHPYFAVTGNDGSFRIENLPPGDYVIEAWHEQYGTQTVNVSVPPNGTVEAPFSFNAGMAATAVVPLGTPIDLHSPEDHHHHHQHGLSSGS